MVTCLAQRVARHGEYLPLEFHSHVMLLLLLLLSSSLFASIGGGGTGSCCTSMCTSSDRHRQLFLVCSTYRRGLATRDEDVDGAGCALGSFAASKGKTWATSLHSAVAHGLRLRGGLREQQGGVANHESRGGSKEQDKGSKEVSKKRPRPKRKAKAIGGGSQLRMYKHVTDAAEELVVYSFLQEEVLKNAKYVLNLQPSSTNTSTPHSAEHCTTLCRLRSRFEIIGR